MKYTLVMYDHKRASYLVTTIDHHIDHLNDEVCDRIVEQLDTRPEDILYVSCAPQDSGIYYVG